MVYFRITTADGRRYVGSVQGFGGQLGGGAAHAGPAREKVAAMTELQDCIEHINATGLWGGRVLESREMPGHCFVTSVKDWKVPHDGKFNQHLVPLAGATVAVLSDEEVRNIHPGTCREDVSDEKVEEAIRLIAGQLPTELPVERDLRATVGTLLSVHGWASTSGTAVATKSYETAVGVKQALAYLCGNMLQGDYQSEGRNALEPHFVPVDNDLSDDELAERVAFFALQADAVVADTYAARLHRPVDQPTNKESLYKTARLRPDVTKEWTPTGFEPGEIVAVKYWKHEYLVTTGRTHPIYMIAKSQDFEKHVAEGSFATVFNTALDSFSL